MTHPSLPLAIMDIFGGSELMIIMLVVLVLFGGDKLPGFARGIAKAMREFKKAASEVESEIKRAMEEAPDNPARKPPAPYPNSLPAAPVSSPPDPYLPDLANADPIDTAPPETSAPPPAAPSTPPASTPTTPPSTEENKPKPPPASPYDHLNDI
jgi:sec-independent protein translocase protein TatA